MGVYAESSYAHRFPGALELRLDGQFTYQRSVGEELLPLPSFATWNLGLRSSTSWRGAVFRIAFLVTGDSLGIFSPYGISPSYGALMQRDFTQAGEKAVLVSVSYSFDELGAPGLSAIMNFARGWDERAQGTRNSSREVDLTFDYRVPPELGLYEGLWLRLRGSFLDESLAGRTGTDIRAVLRYDFPVV